MIKPITILHEQYDKISDDLLFIGNNVLLKFNVSLSKTTDAYGRQSYHKEFQYRTKNFDGDLFSIKRSFDFYFSIENLKPLDNGTKEFIRIGIKEIIFIRQSLNQALDWFTNIKYEKLFAKKDNKLIMVGRVEPIKVTKLPMDKYLILEPIVGNYNYNDQQYPGIRLYLSSDSNYVDFTIDTLMGLIYLLNTDMYTAAQLMLNYLQRPDYGTNLYSFSSGNSTDDLVGSSIQSGRKIPSQTNKGSYFDSLDKI